MGSPCEYSAQCTTFEISFNATCYFTAPLGYGDHRATVTGDVNYKLESIVDEEECASAFVYRETNSSECGRMVNGTCVLIASDSSFISLPRGGIVVAGSSSDGPYFTFTGLPRFVSGQLQINIHPSAPCYAIPDRLQTEDGNVIFYNTGTGKVFASSGPFTRPFLLTEPLYCSGNGWGSSNMLCTERLDLYLPPFSARVSATTTLVPSLIGSEFSLLFVWLLMRLFL